jgi:hypothetical protein
MSIIRKEQLTNPLSASYALTASYAENGGGGDPFPYTGSAEITGSLTITGSFKVSQSIDTTTRHLLASNNVGVVRWGNQTLNTTAGASVINWSNQTLNLTNNKIFDILKNKSNVIWNISFETIGRRFEYVRHGA